MNSSPAGSGATLAPSGFATGDDVMCTVLANDGNQDGTSVSASIFVNGPPIVSSVTISPNPATASDSLGCTYNYIDTESDTDQSTITWTLNGVDVLTGSTLASGFVAGDEIGCRVNAADAYSAGNEEINSLTINTPPSVASATITPDPVSVLDTLYCDYTFDDPDPLNLDQSTVEWIVNGVPSSTGTALTYAFVGGETVECTVTPFDGIEYGASVVQSASSRVNRVPDVSNVSVLPSVTFGDDDLTCTYDYTDADFDLDQSTIEWRVNGFAVGTNALLPHYEVDEGDDVVCEVTPYDGVDYGVAVTDSIQVLHTEREWCGDITQDTVWEAHLPHRVTCDVKVEGASNPTLTVEDGAVILFDNYASIDIGYDDGGRLVVDGHTLGVTFTSSKTNPLPGDWEGVRFFSHDQFSSLTGLDIAYSGGSNTGSVYIS